jgi:hypothetical protein
VDGGENLIYMGDASSCDFLEMLRNDGGCRKGKGALFLVSANPWLFE